MLWLALIWLVRFTAIGIAQGEDDGTLGDSSIFFGPYGR